MKKIIITDKEIIKKILKNKSNCNEMILYIMGKDEKLAIIKTDTMKKRIFIFSGPDQQRKQVRIFFQM